MKHSLAEMDRKKREQENMIQNGTSNQISSEVGRDLEEQKTN